MKKKMSIMLALALAVSTVCSAFTFASAATADLSQTRYRFPVLNIDSVQFSTGKSIDEMKSTASFLKSSNAANNKAGGLFHATIEKYPHLDTGNNANKALVIKYEHKDLLANPDFVGYTFNPTKKNGIGAGNGPLRGQEGIPSNSSDHGIMVHVEMKSLNPEDAAKGFQYFQEKTATQEAYTVDNYETDFNITWQELDFNPDGSKRYQENDPTIQAQSAWNVGKGNDITYIWTKDVNVKVKRSKRDASGKLIKDDKGLEIPEEITINKKVGQKDTMKSGGLGFDSDGTIFVPGSFCGYVLIPFSSFKEAWNSENPNGKMDLQVVELVNIYTSAYPGYKGIKIFDDYAFYGPRFKNVLGALDYDGVSNTNFKIKSKPVSGDNIIDPGSDIVQASSKAPGGSDGSTGGGGGTSADPSASTSGDSSDGSETTDVPSDGSLVSGSESGTNSSNSGKPTGGSQTENPNNLWWVWIIVGVVVLAGAGAAVFFIMKNKKASEDDMFGTEDGDVETDLADEENDSEDDNNIE